MFHHKIISHANNINSNESAEPQVASIDDFINNLPKVMSTSMLAALRTFGNSQDAIRTILDKTTLVQLDHLFKICEESDIRKIFISCTDKQVDKIFRSPHDNDSILKILQAIPDSQIRRIFVHCELEHIVKLLGASIDSPIVRKICAPLETKDFIKFFSALIELNKITDGAKMDNILGAIPDSKISTILSSLDPDIHKSFPLLGSGAFFERVVRVATDSQVAKKLLPYVNPSHLPRIIHSGSATCMKMVNNASSTELIRWVNALSYDDDLADFLHGLGHIQHRKIVDEVTAYQLQRILRVAEFNHLISSTRDDESLLQRIISSARGDASLNDKLEKAKAELRKTHFGNGHKH